MSDEKEQEFDSFSVAWLFFNEGEIKNPKRVKIQGKYYDLSKDPCVEVS